MPRAAADESVVGNSMEVGMPRVVRGFIWWLDLEIETDNPAPRGRG